MEITTEVLPIHTLEFLKRILKRCNEKQRLSKKS
jgi:hypothetical protein